MLTLDIANKEGLMEQLILPSPLMRGYTGAGILSQIKNYIKTLPTYKLLTSKDPEAIKVREYEILKGELNEIIEANKKAFNEEKDAKKLNAISNKLTAKQKELEELTESYKNLVQNNIGLLFDLQGGSGDTELGYIVLDRILNFYDVKESLRNRELYFENDINIILRYIASEKKNDIFDFLAFIPQPKV